MGHSDEETPSHIAHARRQRRRDISPPGANRHQWLTGGYQIDHVYHTEELSLSITRKVTRKGIQASTRCAITYAVLPSSVPTLVSISIRWGASLRHSAGPAPSASIHSRVFAPAGRCLGAACAHSAGPSPVAYIRRSHQNSSFQGARGLPYIPKPLHELNYRLQ